MRTRLAFRCARASLGQLSLSLSLSLSSVERIISKNRVESSGRKTASQPDYRRRNSLAMKDCMKLFLVALFCYISIVSSDIDPNDLAVLDAFRKGLHNPELLNWPSDNNDPCSPPLWPHVICSVSRVTQIQVQKLGLRGSLPPNLNQLSMLTDLGLQDNNFSGGLPSFRGLSMLQRAYMGLNSFDTIPSDFFVGLTSLKVLSLDHNPLNQSTGWALPREIQDSSLLTNLTMNECNLIGPLPDFLGTMPSLKVLMLSYNKLSGGIPLSFSGSSLEILWLNDQEGIKLSGMIDVITSMSSLVEVKLHGNQFTGMIPDTVWSCTSLMTLWLMENQLVGPIPNNLVSLPHLHSLKLDNNKLMGMIPKTELKDFTYDHNSFCLQKPGVPCSPEVNILLDFLGSVHYPYTLASYWHGNDPCTGDWIGLSCHDDKVSVINLPNFKLNGSISPSLAKLNSLVDIRLQGNNLNGTVPGDLTRLKSLRMLNISGNNLAPPIPKFNSNVTLITSGNPLLESSNGDSIDSSCNRSAPRLKHLVIIVFVVFKLIVV